MRFALLRQTVYVRPPAAGIPFKAKPVRYVAKFFLIKWVHVYGHQLVAARSSEYATALGVSDKTVTKVMRELVAAGLMSRSAIKSGKRGRPSNGYKISEATLCLIEDAEVVDLVHVASRIDTLLSEKSAGNLFGRRLLEMTLLAHSDASGQVSLSKREVLRLTGMSWQSVINSLIRLQRIGRVTSIRLPYSEHSFIKYSDLIVRVRISGQAPVGCIRFLLPADVFQDVQGGEIVNYLASGGSGVVRSPYGDGLIVNRRRALMTDQRSRLGVCGGDNISAYVQHVVEHYAVWVLQEKLKLVDVPCEGFLLCDDLKSMIRDDVVAGWTAHNPELRDALVGMLHDVILNFALGVKNYFINFSYYGKRFYGSIFWSCDHVYVALDGNYHGRWPGYALGLYVCHEAFVNASGETYEIPPGAWLDANSLKSSRE